MGFVADAVSSVFGGGGGSSSGGSNTTVTKTEIPKWLEKPTIRNIERAEKAAKIGYMPYMGLDVAGFTPTQLASQQMGINAANAFGMLGPQYQAGGATPLTPMSGMPQMQTIGGVSGWSSFPMYEAALRELEAAQPEQAEQYRGLFV